jgi:hypothetical protein
MNIAILRACGGVDSLRSKLYLIDNNLLSKHILWTYRRDH